MEIEHEWRSTLGTQKLNVVHCQCPLDTTGKAGQTGGVVMAAKFNRKIMRANAKAQQKL